SEEGLAHVGNVFSRDPDALVSHGKQDGPLLCLKRSGHLDRAGPAGQRLEGIHNKVDHDLLHLLRVSVQAWQALGEPHAKAVRSFLDDISQQPQSAMHNLVQLKRLARLCAWPHKMLQVGENSLDTPSASFDFANE